MTVLSHVRCFSCGKTTPVAEAVRRDVVVGSGSIYGGAAGHPIIGDVSVRSREDFCGACHTAEVEREKRLHAGILSVFNALGEGLMRAGRLVFPALTVLILVGVIASLLGCGLLALLLAALH